MAKEHGMGEVAKRETTREATALAVQTDSDTALMQVIARAAADPNVDLDKMQRLLDMQERVMAKRAEMAFIAAMAAFKANPPTIVKNKHVAFGQTAYDHATLDNVCREIIGGLSAHGISHRWATAQDANKVKVTCILTHIAGHSEATALESTYDTSGSKNPIQAIGSAITYLQRYTLLAATGLATGGQDDDGRGTAAGAETITESQEADLIALLTEKGANREKFLAYCKVKAFSEILAVNYSAVCAALHNYKPKVST